MNHQLQFIFENGNIQVKFRLCPIAPVNATQLAHRFERQDGLQAVQAWADKHKAEFVPYGNGNNYLFPTDPETIAELDAIILNFGFQRRKLFFWNAMLIDGSTTVILEEAD